MPADSTLYLICGKVAAGKSTLAKSLAERPNTLLLQEDALLSGLFSDRLITLSDYVECSERLRKTMGPHIVSLLKTGLSVVLDFQANTSTSRLWMRSLFEAADSKHELHVLDVPDAVCKSRLSQRNAARAHEFTVSEDQFDRISRHFEPPMDAEGFQIHWHTT